MASIDPLPPDALYRRCDPNQFEFESTAKLAPLDGVIGQERALAALRFGIGMRYENYHLFALGPPGVGKHAVLRRVLEERAAAESVPSDWVLRASSIRSASSFLSLRFSSSSVFSRFASEPSSPPDFERQV